MGMGVDDGLNWFWGYLPKFSQDFSGSSIVVMVSTMITPSSPSIMMELAMP
jgi:hypothetical protein